VNRPCTRKWCSSGISSRSRNSRTTSTIMRSSSEISKSIRALPSRVSIACGRSRRRGFESYPTFCDHVTAGATLLDPGVCDQQAERAAGQVELGGLARGPRRGVGKELDPVRVHEPAVRSVGERDEYLHHVVRRGACLSEQRAQVRKRLLDLR